MADNTVDIRVKINAETNELEVLGAKFKQAGEGARRAGGMFSGLDAETRQLLGTLGLLAGATELARFFKDAVSEAIEAEEAQRRLKFALESTGQSFEKMGPGINAWADGLQRVTRFADTEAVSALERFVQATGNVKESQHLVQLAMDMTVQAGGNLADRTGLLIRLANGQERAIREARNEFGKFVGEATTTEEAMRNLAHGLAGASLAEEGSAKTTSQTREEFKKYREELGDAFLPVVNLVAKALLGVADIGRTMTAFLRADIEVGIDGFKGLGEAIDAVAHRRFGDLKAIGKRTFDEMAVDGRAFVEKTKSIWTDVTDAQIREINRADDLRANRSQEQLDKEQEYALKTKQIAAEVDANIAKLGEDTFEHKKKLLEAEISARRQAVITQFGGERNAAQALVALDREATARRIELARLEAKAKRTLAYDTLDTIAQTLGIINELHAAGTQGEITRARLILALEKVIAIARIWSAHAANPILAAANTALVVAQFAQQSRALGQVQSSFDQQGGEATVGGDIPSDQPGGGPIRPRSGGGGLAPAGGGASSGGGTVIHVGGVYINLAFEKLTPENVKPIAVALTEAARRGVIEGVQLAIQLETTAAKNAGRAA
jgi:hypothetical protein